MIFFLSAAYGWKNNFPTVKEFWSDILFYRGLNLPKEYIEDEILKIRKINKRKKKQKSKDNFLFLSDSD